MPTKTTHCRHGHERTPENIYIAPNTGAVGCKPCRRIASRNFVSVKGDWDFGGNRELVIQRDGEKYVRCGMTREEHRIKHGRDITVDHKDKKGSRLPVSLKNNTVENLQTLCLTCHTVKDSVLEKKLTEEDVRDIRMFYKAGIGYTEIARAYQRVSSVNIWLIVKRQTWKWVQ